MSRIHTKDVVVRSLGESINPPSQRRGKERGDEALLGSCSRLYQLSLDERPVVVWGGIGVHQKRHERADSQEKEYGGWESMLSLVRAAFLL